MILLELVQSPLVGHIDDASRDRELHQVTMAVAAQDLVLRYLVKPHDLLELKRFNPGDRVTGFVDLCLDRSVELRVVRICAKLFRRRKHTHGHVKGSARAHMLSPRGSAGQG